MERDQVLHYNFVSQADAEALFRATVKRCQDVFLSGSTSLIATQVLASSTDLHSLLQLLDEEQSAAPAGQVVAGRLQSKYASQIKSDFIATKFVLQLLSDVRMVIEAIQKAAEERAWLSSLQQSKEYSELGSTLADLADFSFNQLNARSISPYTRVWGHCIAGFTRQSRPWTVEYSVVGTHAFQGGNSPNSPLHLKALKSLIIFTSDHLDSCSPLILQHWQNQVP